METSELKIIANENGYEFSFDESSFTIVLKRDTLFGCNLITISRKIKNRIIIENYGWSTDEDIRVVEAAIAYAKTSLNDRKSEDEKRYIIPLPHLVTTDGEQQYLTHNGSFFASRRDKELRQTWKEEHLKYIPEEYRKYAVEVEEWTKKKQKK